MTDRPPPLTPCDADLRNFGFMPIDIARLFGSRFHAIATGDEWRAGVTLWLKSFHQVPAGSVPSDEIELARLAEYGRDIRAWRKVQTVALHGWIECHDGRLYHPVVAEKVLEAVKKKDAFRERSRKANEKRWAKHNSGDEPGGGEGKSTHERHDVEGCGESGGSRRKAQQSVSNGDAKALPEASYKEEIRTPRSSQGTGTGTGSSSVTSVTAAPSAPPVADPPPVEAAADAYLWDAGKRFLQARGIAKSKTGTLIGKWKRDHGTGMVIEALGFAEREPGLVDPIPFIEKILRRRSGTDGETSNMIGGVRMSSPC